MVLLSLTPYGFSLRFYTGVSIEKRNRTIENAQGTLNFNREVNVTWSIDDVEATLLAITTFPERGFRQEVPFLSQDRRLADDIARADRVLNQERGAAQ
jgi:hypothetical protein